MWLTWGSLWGGMQEECMREEEGIVPMEADRKGNLDAELQNLGGMEARGVEKQ